jgi:hypothetical protein
VFQLQQWFICFFFMPTTSLDLALNCICKCAVTSWSFFSPSPTLKTRKSTDTTLSKLLVKGPSKRLTAQIEMHFPAFSEAQGALGSQGVVQTASERVSPVLNA